jgi:hypothetical protein
MAWTYDVTQLATSSLFQVRFYCGDTDSTRQLVQDEEIEFVLLSQPSSPLAAAIVCDAVAAKLSQEADARAGDLSESSSQKAEAFRQRAKDLRQNAARLAKPIFGGITKTQKENLERDTDLVQPSFRIGQDEHPELPSDRGALLPWWSS